METALGLLGLLTYIVVVIGLAGAVTYLVVRFGPGREKPDAGTTT